MERLDKTIAFLKEAEKLKLIEREIYLSNRSRKENNAEHSWYMGMILMMLEKELKGFDLLKLHKMMLIHDLTEIYAGDVCAFDPKRNPAARKKEEEKAAEKLFGLLPSDLKEELHKLWQEYEAKMTKEAKIAQAIDKLSAEMQQIVSDGKSLKEWKVTHQQVFDYKRELIESHEATKKMMERINEELLKIDL